MITFKPKLVVNDKIAKIVNAPPLLIFLMSLYKFWVAGIVGFEIWLFQDQNFFRLKKNNTGLSLAFNPRIFSLSLADRIVLSVANKSFSPGICAEIK